MQKKTGSCLCGGVSYEVQGELRHVVACHCNQCRKTSGHYVAATQALQANVAITGTTLNWFQSSDTAERGFCGTCGSNLFWRRHGNPYISILAGTIDGPTGLKIESQIHTESAGDYYDLPHVPIIDQSQLS
ncbi:MULTISPECIES: GFA family protein [unclassified Sinorhizobium]|uniref:GFA family protein n=1 Tax=unclassified Sinorhizobium TaxID=2613772 RepID=UPI003523D68B